MKRVSVWEDGKVLEMDGHTTVYMHLMPLICTPKNN